MTHEFDKGYWERHWQQVHESRPESRTESVANPYLARELDDLATGTALDAGCGGGADAIWLASHGWRVTAADIAPEVLARAAENADSAGVSESIEWIEADLSVWEPGAPFDLVTTFYAHPAMPQLAFYQRTAGWVAPGGTLLIVGHLHTSEPAEHSHGEGDQPPAETLVTAAGITAGLDDTVWEIVTADEYPRDAHHGDQAVPLHDVIVRAERRSSPNRLLRGSTSPSLAGLVHPR